MRRIFALEKDWTLRNAFRNKGRERVLNTNGIKVQKEEPESTFQRKECKDMTKGLKLLSY